jgi:hypothetical protein
LLIGSPVASDMLSTRSRNTLNIAVRLSAGLSGGAEPLFVAFVCRPQGRTTFRLNGSVVVHAGPSVKGFEVEIKGGLQELLGAPFLRLSMGGGLVVAGERYGLKPRHARLVSSPLIALENHRRNEISSDLHRRL